jgi:hypothetical protein
MERGVMKPVVMILPERRIGFHPNNVCCDGCPMAVADTGYNRDRKKCFLTGEIIYEKKQLGMFCPLIPEENNHV